MSEKSLNSKPGKKWYAQCFREEWLQDPALKDWLKPDDTNKNISFCSYCNIQLKNANKSMLMKHKNTDKHKKRFETSNGDVNDDCFIKKRILDDKAARKYCGKLELNDTDIFDSSEEIDQSLTDFQIESPSYNCLPPTKKLMTKSSGIERKALDEAVGNFYKAINTSSEVSSSNFEDSDEAFGRYLGKEIRNIKNISVKKKLKLKLMNMVLNADDSADENNSPRPFPIFVSTSQKISFPKVNNKSAVSNDDL